MKTPPPPDLHVARAVDISERRDGRFLVFVAVVLVALTLGLKSELVAPTQVWAFGAGLLVLAFPALLGYLRTDEGAPSVESFIPVAIGAVAVAGLSTFPMDWWKFDAMVALFGLGFVLSGWLDHRRLREREKPGHVVLQETVMILAMAAAFLVVLTVALPLPVRLGWIFAISLLATYRSFRSLGRVMPPRRAFLFSVFVAQLVTFFSWASTVYLSYQEGPMAAILVFLWYVNRGIIRHTVEETMSRNVVIEYGSFVILLGYLVYASYTPHPG
ncbi:MAG: hypothetical protein E6I08_00540 [Chloroflexi bacterium]|nr:MAG: hypothetical protein E6I08_00540 [Chloroflexota bacterium]